MATTEMKTDEEHGGPDHSQGILEPNEASVTDHYGRPWRICHAAKRACWLACLGPSFPSCCVGNALTAVGGPGVMRAGGP